MPSSFTIRFLPEGVEYRSTAPVDLTWAAVASGILIEHPCGGAGTCGNCRVRLVGEAPEPRPADREWISAADLEAGWRLSCQLVIQRDVTVEVPVTSRSPAGKSFEGDGDLDDRDPVVTRRVAVVPARQAARPEADVERVGRALGYLPRALDAAPGAVASVADAFGHASTLDVALDGATLLRAVPAGGRPLFGVAVDLGSTSLAAAVVDLDHGGVATSGSRLNAQVTFGSDVVSRIHHAREHAAGAAQLTEAIRTGVAGLVRDLIAAAGCRQDDVVHAVVVGNPAMLHTWAGVSPASLGESPYAAAWAAGLSCRAIDVGLPILEHGPVWVPPLVASYVGADAVSAAVAVNLDRASRPTLLVDLGTNTELMLADGRRLLATSAAAGPAFEGATIRHGMRAAPGAIDAVRILADGQVRLTTVGHAPPIGLCGSGLIDLVAGLRGVGLISDTGLLAAAGDAPATWQATDRLVTEGGQRAFVVVRRGVAGAPRDVVLTAGDVRQLQLVKGSILAGIEILCDRAGLASGDLDAILLAGAFGNYVRKAAVLAIGLVPSVAPERLRFVGNAAGAGARLCLLDRRARSRAEALARSAEYLELASRPDYEPRFLDALAFPPAVERST